MNTNDFIKFFVDISGNYENVSLEVSINRNPLERPSHKFIAQLFHTHPSYEFFYVKSGCGLFIQTKDQEPLLLRKGDVCIIPPFCEHYTYPEQSTTNFDQRLLILDLTFYEIHPPAPRDFYRILSAFLNANGAAPVVVRKEDRDGGHIDELLSSFERAIDDHLLKTAFLDFCKILEVLLQSELTEKPSFSKTDIIRKINYIISTSYIYDINLADLAERFHLSERSLNRIVSEYYHDTFLGLLTKQRMLIASSYLENTDFPIAKIAEISGYESSSNFYAAFKKHFGMLPVEYRKHKKSDKA